MRIGVGDSLRYLKKNPLVAARLMFSSEYRPDELLHGLSQYLPDPAFNICGFHVYCFNEVEKTEQWRHDFLERLD